MIKKLFYFLLVLAIVVAIDHPTINQLYDDTIGQFKMFARDSINTSKNPGAYKVLQDIKKHFDNYSQNEKILIEKVTKNNQTVLAFRESYCIAGDFHPMIYGDHLEQFCSIIRKHKAQLQAVVL
jgi:hypothetical protein